MAATEFSVADEQAMRQALDQAQNAWLVGEVPVGAVLVREDEHGVPHVVATGYNRPVTTNDPTAHAELVALRHAADLLGNYRLPDCTLYVTLEPCAMCAMALMHARIRRVVFGAPDPKTGAAGSVIDLFGVRQLNHQTTLQGGCLAEACGGTLRAFFAERRAEQKARQAERRAAAGGVLFGDARPAGEGPSGPGDAEDVDDDAPGDLGPDADPPVPPALDLLATEEGEAIPVAQVEEFEPLPVGLAVEVDDDPAFAAPQAADAPTDPLLHRPER